MSDLYFFVVSQVGLFGLGFLVARLAGPNVKAAAQAAVDELAERIDRDPVPRMTPPPRPTAAPPPGFDEVSTP